MKKIIASILLFTITVLSIVNCFAKENINKDNLQNAFNELAKKYEGSYKTIKGSIGFASHEETTPIKVEIKTLAYEEEQFGEKVTKKINYELSDNPKFYIEKTINKNTSLSELYSIGEDMELPIKGVVGSAIVQGVPAITASSFEDEFDADRKIRKYSSIMLVGNQLSVGNMEDENDVKIFKKGEFDNFEFLDYAINDEVELKDELFNFYTYKFTKTQKSDYEYLLRAEVIVNLDADLSSIIENKKQNEENNTVSNNTVNKLRIIANTTSNKATNNVINNTVDKVVNNTANKIANNTTKNSILNTNNNISYSSADKKAPFVGTDDTIPTLIFIGLCFVMFNIIKLKNIDKRIEEEKKKNNN